MQVLRLILLRITLPMNLTAFRPYVDFALKSTIFSVTTYWCNFWLTVSSCCDVCVHLFVNVSSDYDECGLGNACEDGECVNTAGSFNCFCSPPLVLDSTRRRCISLNTTEGATTFFNLNVTSLAFFTCRSCAELLINTRGFVTLQSVYHRQ